MDIKLDKQFIEEIRPFEIIICTVSGGIHSTVSALKLKEYGFENVILLHNITLLEMRSSIQTMIKLQEFTNYPYFKVYPNLGKETIWDILRRSLQKIPEVRKDIEEDKRNRGKKGYKKKYDRHKFECCKKLKKDPSKEFYNFIDKKNSVVISSLCPFESDNRGWRLNELRNKDTYLRLHKKFGNVWHAYPFRDIIARNSDTKLFRPYLYSKGFGDTQHSGCVICPILYCFDLWKEAPVRYHLTKKAMIRAGMPCFQKTIMDFMEV